MKQNIVFLFFLSLGFSALTQSFGGHLPGIQWKSIDTEQTRIIYEDGQYDRAARMASLIQDIAANRIVSIGDRYKKIDIVLQTHQVVANGYVGLAPFRSEFFATPPQSTQILGSLDWLDILTIHEYRHVLQNYNGRRGFTNLGYAFGGQQGWAALYFLAMPNWFTEGDATMSETVLSDAGRGRTASFFKEQRALLLKGSVYNYMKARNGSYKDLVPDQYRLGYNLVNYGRNNFGTDIWAKVIADAGRYRSIIYPFSGAMRRHMGLGSRKFYQQSYEALQAQWISEWNSLKLTDQQRLTPIPDRTITNYNFPNYLKDGSLVYIGNSYSKNSALYLLKEGKKTLLTKIGITQEAYLSANNGKVVWTEFSQHPRWRNSNYSDVVIFDLDSKQKKYLTNHSKYFSPEYANQKDQIVVVKNDEKLASNIVLLDANKGTELQTISNPEKYALSYPKWSHDDQEIIFVAKKNSEVAILKYNLKSSKTIQLTPWSAHPIGGLDVGKKIVAFSAGYSGIDNIYSVSLFGGKKVVQISGVKVGAYNPTINEDEKITFSEFSDKGYLLSELPILLGISEERKIVEPKAMETFNIRLGETEGNILLEKSDQKYVEEDYKGFFKGTQLHSWGFNGQTAVPGIELQFRNVLNDLTAGIELRRNLNENTFQYSSNITYAKYFPRFTLSGGVNNRSATFLAPTDGIETFRFQEQLINLGMDIPLQWIKGNFTTNFAVDTRLTLHDVDFTKEDAPDDFNTGSWTTAISFSKFRRRAFQNLQSTLGVQLSTSFAVGLGKVSAGKFNFASRFFLPGIAPNHGIRITAAYQDESLANAFQFSDNFPYPRGSNASKINNQVARLSFDYQFPMLYPDIGFLGLIYCKRIRANLFTDMLWSDYSVQISETPTTGSYGVELVFDLNVFNVLPVGVGLRNSWKIEADPFQEFNGLQVFFDVDF